MRVMIIKDRAGEYNLTPCANI